MSRYNPSWEVCMICAMEGQDLVNISYERDKEMCNRFEFLLQIKFDWEDPLTSKKFCAVCIHLLRSFSLYFNWCHNAQKMLTKRGTDARLVGEVVHFSNSEECPRAESLKWELKHDLSSMSGECRTPTVGVLVPMLPDHIKEEVIKEKITDTQIAENFVGSNNFSNSAECLRDESRKWELKDDLSSTSGEGRTRIVDVLVPMLPDCIKKEVIKEEITATQITENVVESNNFSNSGECPRAESRKWELKNDLSSTSGEVRTPQIDVLVPMLPDHIKKEIIKEGITETQIAETGVESNNSELSVELPFETVACKLESELPPQCDFEHDGNGSNDDVSDKVLVDETASCVSSTNNRLNNGKVQNVFPKVVRSGKRERKRKLGKVPVAENTSRSKKKQLEEDNRRNTKTTRMKLPKSIPGRDSPSAAGDETPKIRDVVISMLLDSVKKEIMEEDTQITENLVDGDSLSESVERLPVEGRKRELQNDSRSASGEDRKPTIDVLVSTLPHGIKEEILKGEVTQVTENLVDGDNVSNPEERLRVESCKRELHNDGEDGTRVVDVLVSTLPDSVKQEIIEEEVTQTTENLVESKNSELSFALAKTEFPLEIAACKLHNTDSELPQQREFEHGCNSSNNDSVADKDETVSCLSSNTSNNENAFPKVTRSGERKRKTKLGKVPAAENTYRLRSIKWEEDNTKRRKTPRMILPKSASGDNVPQIGIPKIDVLVSTLPESMKKGSADTGITENPVDGNNSEFPVEPLKTEFPFVTVVCNLLNTGSELPPKCEFEPDCNSFNNNNNNNNVADEVSVDETDSGVSYNRLNNEEVVIPVGIKRKRKLGKNTCRSKSKQLEEDNRIRRKTPRMILPKSVSGDNVPKIEVLRSTSPAAIDAVFPFEAVVWKLCDPDSELPPQRGEFEPDCDSLVNNDNVADEVSLVETVSCGSNNRLGNETVENGFVKVARCGERERNKNAPGSNNKKSEEDKRIRISPERVSGAGDSTRVGAPQVARKSTAVKRNGRTWKLVPAHRDSRNLAVNSIDLNIVKKMTEDIVSSIKLQLDSCEQLFPDGFSSSEKYFLPVLKRELKHLLEADYVNM